jgi:hypothetical protein
LNQAYLHQLSPDTTPKAGLDDRAVDSFASEALSRYDSSQFYGIVIDTGAAKRSTAGISQFQAFQRLSPAVSLNESSRGKVTV